MSNCIEKLFYPFDFLDVPNKKCGSLGYRFVVARERIRFCLGNRRDIAEAWKNTVMAHYGDEWKSVVALCYGPNWYLDVQNSGLPYEIAYEFLETVLRNGDIHMGSKYGLRWASDFMREFDQHAV